MNLKKYKHIAFLFIVFFTTNLFAFKVQETTSDSISNIFRHRDEIIQNEERLIEKHEKSEKLLLIFTTLFVLAGFIFYFYYQNLLLKQKSKMKDIDAKLQYKIISATLDGRDTERNKISGVLHDNISAVLSSVGLHLSALENNLNENQIIELQKIRVLLKNAHDKVRDLSHELVPPLLFKFGLSFALKDLTEKNSNSLLVFNFKSNLKKEKRFNAELETKIYFIVSELFNNVIKHSKASEANLFLEEIIDKLIITVQDNGIGFNEKNVNMSNGFGINQIRARLKSMDGIMKTQSSIEDGTSIIISIKIPS